MLFHLLVVGAINSNDQGPVGPCKRLNGERGDGGGPIGGEIGPPPPSQVSLTPLGLTSTKSQRLKELEEAESLL
jgi:hypothetical protein